MSRVVSHSHRQVPAGTGRTADLCTGSNPVRPQPPQPAVGLVPRLIWGGVSLPGLLGPFVLGRCSAASDTHGGGGGSRQAAVRAGGAAGAAPALLLRRLPGETRTAGEGRVPSTPTHPPAAARPRRGEAVNSLAVEGWARRRVGGV